MIDKGRKRVAFLSFDWDYEIVSQYYRGMASFTNARDDLQVVVFSAFGHYHKLFDVDEGAFKVFSDKRVWSRLVAKDCARL